jgi:hypothetical protein
LQGLAERADNAPAVRKGRHELNSARCGDIRCEISWRAEEAVPVTNGFLLPSKIVEMRKIGTALDENKPLYCRATLLF